MLKRVTFRTTREPAGAVITDAQSTEEYVEMVPLAAYRAPTTVASMAAAEGSQVMLPENARKALFTTHALLIREAPGPQARHRPMEEQEVQYEPTLLLQQNDVKHRPEAQVALVKHAEPLPPLPTALMLALNLRGWGGERAGQQRIFMHGEARWGHKRAFIHAYAQT